jgi:hypothetical protein
MMGSSFFCSDMILDEVVISIVMQAMMSAIIDSAITIKDPATAYVLSTSIFTIHWILRNWIKSSANPLLTHV